MSIEIVVGLGVGILFVIALGYIILSERLPVDVSGLSKEEQRAVKIALADDRVRNLLNSKQAELKTVQVGGGSSGSCQYICAFVVFAQIEDENRRMLVVADMTTGDVAAITDPSWS